MTVGIVCRDCAQNYLKQLFSAELLGIETWSWLGLRRKRPQRPEKHGELFIKLTGPLLVFLTNAVMYFVTLTISWGNKRGDAKNMAVSKKWAMRSDCNRLSRNASSYYHAFLSFLLMLAFPEFHHLFSIRIQRMNSRAAGLKKWKPVLSLPPISELADVHFFLKGFLKNYFLP